MKHHHFEHEEGDMTTPSHRNNVDKANGQTAGTSLKLPTKYYKVNYFMTHRSSTVLEINSDNCSNISTNMDS